jgi:hypothetical protein
VPREDHNNDGEEDDNANDDDVEMEQQPGALV